MDYIEPQRLIIRWITRDVKAKQAICKHFGWKQYSTLNDLSPVALKLSDTPMFNECVRRGFFGVIPGKWWQNGGPIIFKFS